MISAESGRGDGIAPVTPPTPSAGRVRGTRGLSVNQFATFYRSPGDDWCDGRFPSGAAVHAPSPFPKISCSPSKSMKLQQDDCRSHPGRWLLESKALWKSLPRSTRNDTPTLPLEIPLIGELISTRQVGKPDLRRPDSKVSSAHGMAVADAAILVLTRN
jgi:hypothetical protein